MAVFVGVAVGVGVGAGVGAGVGVRRGVGNGVGTTRIGVGTSVAAKIAWMRVGVERGIRSASVVVCRAAFGVGVGLCGGGGGITSGAVTPVVSVRVRRIGVYRAS